MVYNFRLTNPIKWSIDLVSTRISSAFLPVEKPTALTGLHPVVPSDTAAAWRLLGALEPGLCRLRPVRL